MSTVAQLQLKYPLAAASTVPHPTGRHGRGLVSSGFNTFVIQFDAQPTWVVGFAFNSAVSVARPAFLVLYDSAGASEQVSVRITIDNGFTVNRGATVLASSSNGLFPNATWHYVEFKATIGNSGSFELRMDGVTILSGSGVDTQASANASADQFRHGSVGGASIYLDDFYFFDGTGATENDFAGDSKVQNLAVTGAGSHTDFTPSAGSNYQNVDEASPDDDTTYNSSPTAGQIDLYALANTAFSGNIKGVTLTAWMRKDDAGSRSAAVYLKSGATEQAGATVSLGNTYQAYLLQLWKDPDTAAAWTAAGVNALEAGAKVIS